MLLTATWKVVLRDPAAVIADLVLMDWSDWQQGEPELEVGGKPQGQVNALRGSYATQRPVYNVTNMLKISRMASFATDALARAFVISHAALIPTVPLNCVIYTNPADLTQLKTMAGALVQRPLKCGTDNSYFHAQYTIIGGQIS